MSQHQARASGSEFSQNYDLAINDPTNSVWSNYQQIANEYLRIQLLDSKESALYAGQSPIVNTRLNSIFNLTKLPISHAFDADRKQALLVQIREAIGVLRLQEQSYSEELEQRLEEVEVLLSQETEKAVELLAQSILDVVLEVSPADDSFPGRYEMNGLTIDYSQGPFTWAVLGTREEFAIEMNVVMPTWRKSSVLGDKIEGYGTAKISKDDLQLSLDLSNISLELDGTIDTSDSKSTVGDGVFEGVVTLSQSNSVLNGEVNLLIKRQLIDDQVDTIETSFLADATINSPSQVTPIKAYANERTPFELDSNNLAFGLEMGLEVNGAKDLKLQYIGEPDKLSQLTEGDVYILNNNKVMEIAIRTAGDNVNLVARGEHGYWLDLKKKGKNYTGDITWEISRLEIFKLSEAYPVFCSPMVHLNHSSR